MTSKVHDQSSDVSSSAGVVLIDGPDGVAISMTPRAALKTAEKLIDKAAEAHGDDLIYEGDV